jgi:hypothetical protein
MRLFQPVGGFPDKHLIGIDDAGHSHNVNADGSAAPVEIVESPTNRALPVWTLGELENLVKGGSWQEVQGDNAKQPETLQPDARQNDSGADAAPAPPQPAEQPDRPTEPQPQGTTADGEPLVRPFPDQH